MSKEEEEFQRSKEKLEQFWREQFEKEKLTYEQLEEKLIKRTAELVDTKNKLSETIWNLREANDLLVQAQHKLKELQNDK